MYRRGLILVAKSLLRGMVLGAVGMGLVGVLLVGPEGLLNGLLLGGAFGTMAGVNGLLGYFFFDAPQKEGDLRWHRGWGPRD